MTEVLLQTVKSQFLYYETESVRSMTPLSKTNTPDSARSEPSGKLVATVTFAYLSNNTVDIGETGNTLKY